MWLLVRGLKARELIRTEFLDDTNRRWIVEEVQERLSMENMEDDFETVLCDFARRGDGTILEEAKKASTILFFNYNWSIEDVVAHLGGASVEHLVRLQHR